MSDSSSDDKRFDFSKLRKAKKKTHRIRKAVTISKNSESSKKNRKNDEVTIIEYIEKNDTNCESLEELIEETQKESKKKISSNVEVQVLDNNNESDNSTKNCLSRSKRTKNDVTNEIDNNDNNSLSSRIEKEILNFQRKREAVENEQQELTKTLTEDRVIKKSHVTIILRIMYKDDEFLEYFKVSRDEQFAEKIFLKYALKAGFEDPKSFDVIWDKGDTIELIKFHDTPNSINMPYDRSINLCILPKRGAVQQVRKLGEIKLKFNIKNEPIRLEMLIHKEKKFGEFIPSFAEKHGFNPKKIHFNFDGERVSDTDTPEILDMEEFDIIDVIQK